MTFTTFATVGFGDTTTAAAARLVVTGQMT